MRTPRPAFDWADRCTCPVRLCGCGRGDAPRAHSGDPRLISVRNVEINTTFTDPARDRGDLRPRAGPGRLPGRGQRQVRGRHDHRPAGRCAGCSPTAATAPTCTPTRAARPVTSAGPTFQNVVDPVQPSVDPAYANPENEIWLDFRTDDDRGRQLAGHCGLGVHRRPAREVGRRARLADRDRGRAGRVGGHRGRLRDRRSSERARTMGQRDRPDHRPPAPDRAVRVRHPGRAGADGRHHQPRVPPAVPGAGRRVLRLRDDHFARPGRAQPADVPDDRLRPGRAAAVDAALRGRPGDHRRRGPDGRRARPRRPRRPQLRLPGAQGHPARRRRGAALQAAAVRRGSCARRWTTPGPSRSP